MLNKLPGGVPVRKVKLIWVNGRVPMIIESEIMPKEARHRAAEEKMGDIFHWRLQ